MSSFEEQARHTALQGPGIKTNKDFPFSVGTVSKEHLEGLLEEARILRQFGRPEDEKIKKSEQDPNRAWYWKWNSTKWIPELMDYCLQYCGDVGKPITRVKFDQQWLTVQSKHEYQPMHHHAQDPNVHLHVIIFLKSPAELRDQSKGLGADQKIKWVDGKPYYLEEAKEGGLDLCLPEATEVLRPNPGRIVILPSNLLHTSYPFKFEGERWALGATVQCLDWPDVKPGWAIESKKNWGKNA
tara:strand:+ start:21747 stop:22469 length:723 start_codon:yes stop_codon:yes gene_type:complete